MAEQGNVAPATGLRLIWKVVRYGFAAVGPIGAAGSQFVLSLQLLHALDPGAFGSFSFLLVTSQLAAGLWSALFCAPMPILLLQGEAAERLDQRRCLMSASLGLSILVGAGFVVTGLLLHADPVPSLLFGIYCTFMLLRWFGRAFGYAMGTQWRTVASDLVYSGVLLAGVGVAFLSHSKSLTIPYGALLISAAVGLLPLGLTYMRQQFLEVSWTDALRYDAVWRVHSRWSLTGVLTTEATANAHAYIVTLVSGPTAFASLAASALLMRPVTVITNALTDLERPQMARELAEGRFEGARRAARFFRFMLVAAWGATVAAALVLVQIAPGVLFPKQYDLVQLEWAASLWMVIALVRLLRSPDSVLLQGAGEFRPLAHASVMSCGVSIVAVAVLLFLGGPLFSLGGVLLGEAVFALWIWRQRRRWESGFPMAALSIEQRI